MLFGESFAFFSGDDHLALSIDFVGHQHFLHELVCVLVELFEPVGYGCEGLPVGAVVHHQNGLGPLVVAICDGLKAFLARSVPKLQLDSLVARIHHFDFEVDSDRGHVVLGEAVLRETHQQTGFSH